MRLNAYLFDPEEDEDDTLYLNDDLDHRRIEENEDEIVGDIDEIDPTNDDYYDDGLSW